MLKCTKPVASKSEMGRSESRCGVCVGVSENGYDKVKVLLFFLAIYFIPT